MLACRESRRVSREAAARILALKDRDYAEYLRLARNTKDKRLRTLLDKTDAIISDLGIKVASSALSIAATPPCVCLSIPQQFLAPAQRERLTALVTSMAGRAQGIERVHGPHDAAPEAHDARGRCKTSGWR